MSSLLIFHLLASFLLFNIVAAYYGPYGPYGQPYYPDYGYGPNYNYYGSVYSNSLHYHLILLMFRPLGNSMINAEYGSFRGAQTGAAIGETLGGIIGLFSGKKRK
jgi:hypothetical protein